MTEVFPRPDYRGPRGRLTWHARLAALVVITLVTGLALWHTAPRLSGTKRQTAVQAIQRLGGILDLYKLDIGNYPTTDQGLAALQTDPGVRGWGGPYLGDARLPVDPWGHPYIYRSPSDRPGRNYDLCSQGADGRTGGTGDGADLCN